MDPGYTISQPDSTHRRPLPAGSHVKRTLRRSWMATHETDVRVPRPLIRATLTALIAIAAPMALTLLPQRSALAAAGPPPNDTTPLAYRIDLTIDPAQTTYTGHVEIDTATK